MNRTKALNKEAQDKITPDKALELLKEGNERFVAKDHMSIDYHTMILQTAEAQFPHTVVLSCIDSRVPSEIILDQGIGDLFNVRIAGNFVNEDILGSIEFATKVSGAKLILVMGHTSCGAVKGACDDVKLGHLTNMLAKIKPAVAAVETPEGTDRSSANAAFVEEVAYVNVQRTMADITAKSAVVKELVDDGTVKVVGAMYDVKTGKVDFWV